MRQLVVQRLASRDLKAIFAWSAGQWGLDQARRYVRNLDAAFVRLAEGSLTGRPVVRPAGDYQRVNIESHAIFFKLTADTTTIIRVLHQRRDIPKHLR